ncbi:hypothetical protein FPRO05_04226 [Fusarium proliferatum]|uniref:Uncharacterized protein n=1 Tax=Gibberella intermedia TaxID=948311 RepID=A0A365MR87_GIBIN|nr:hypothetical protein FPRO05_04226 [Fusarium proliferatum]
MPNLEKELHNGNGNGNGINGNTKIDEDSCINPHSFGIIGGGWYGCHIATSLRALGFRVKLFEQHSDCYMKHLATTSSGCIWASIMPVTVVEDGVLIEGERFDFVVDATWGHYMDLDLEVIYEATLLLYYEGPSEFPAVTLVDGPLASVYPTEMPGLFTLSSVPHTPLGQFKTAAEARAARDDVSPATISAKRALMEEQIMHYLPTFLKTFRYIGPQLAVKTKPLGAYDDRSCRVSRRGRVFSVMSGKIDTIFFAHERILSLIDDGS